MTFSVSHDEGDPDITVQSGSNLTFTTENWSAEQSVTLAAAHDDDAEAGRAVIRISADTELVADVVVGVLEVEDDLPLLTPPCAAPLVVVGVLGLGCAAGRRRQCLRR